MIKNEMSWWDEYSTDRVVQIPNKCLSLTWYFIVFVIFIYIFCYAILWKKEYQESCQVGSVVVSKVKGVLETRFTDEELGVPNPHIYRRFWDSYEIVTHTGDAGGFFVLTNVVITPNQTRSVCPEISSVRGAICNEDRDCVRGKALKLGHGFMTGKCINASEDTSPTNKTCQIEAWCPIEPKKVPLGGRRALLLDTKEFTVYVKNSIEFPLFGPAYKRRNILDYVTKSMLQDCTYNRETDPYCPTFRIGDIVDGAGENYDEVALTGGIFALQINWNCDFDWGKTIRHCLPVYSFARMDSPNAAMSPGFNFRSATYLEDNRRTLTKKYGIKFLIMVEGEGKKFCSVKFVLTVGASMGLFALSTVICDLSFRILCKLKLVVNWEWIHFYDEEMKFDNSLLESSNSNNNDHRLMREMEEIEVKILNGPTLNGKPG